MSEVASHIEALINQGHYFEARTKAEEELKSSTDNLRYRQLYALSLSKLGAPELALEYMEPVHRQFPDDPESAGILGSIYKELFKKNQSTPFAIKSRDTYFKNFSATKNYYTGVNAASMSAMAGQASRSREIATEVITLLQDNTQDFWQLATLGEAQLLIKNRDKSVEYYIRARQLAGKDWGKITSVHNQLWLLNHFLPVPSEILRLYSPPNVVAFVGHMIDHSERPTPRFPASIELVVKNSILNSIRTLNARIGYCSLACGGDILFAEAMAEEGGELNIFIPFAINDFIKTSIVFAGEEWVNRFQRLIKNFPVTLVTSDNYAGHDDLFSFQSRIIFGSAVLRGASYHAEPRLITVLSEVDLKKQEGGTRDTIRLWPYPQHHVNINPDIFTSTNSFSNQSVSFKPKPAVKSAERPVLYLVYVNIQDLSLPEREKIFNMCRERLEDEVDPLKAADLEKESVLMAFETESAAMDFVQSIVEAMEPLKHESVIQISLHAGPVYLEMDSHQKNGKPVGENVQLVKAINRLAAPGSIYASDHFAALLALHPKKFMVDYAGVFIPEGQEKTQTIYRVGF